LGFCLFFRFGLQYWIVFILLLSILRSIILSLKLFNLLSCLNTSSSSCLILCSSHDMKRKRSNNIPPRFQRLQKEKQEASKKENYATQNNEKIQSQHFLDQQWAWRNRPQPYDMRNWSYIPERNVFHNYVPSVLAAKLYQLSSSTYPDKPY
jgi:hypothetical protein